MTDTIYSIYYINIYIYFSIYIYMTSMVEIWLFHYSNHIPPWCLWLGPRLDHRLGHLAGQVEAWRIDMFKLSDGFDQNVDPQELKNKCTILH